MNESFRCPPPNSLRITNICISFDTFIMLYSLILISSLEFLNILSFLFQVNLFFTAFKCNGFNLFTFKVPPNEVVEYFYLYIFPTFHYFSSEFPGIIVFFLFSSLFVLVPSFFSFFSLDTFH